MGTTMGKYKYIRATFNNRPGYRSAVDFEFHTNNSVSNLDKMITDDMELLDVKPNDEYIISKSTHHTTLTVFTQNAALKVVKSNDDILPAQKIKDCISIINFFNVMCEKSGTINGQSSDVLDVLMDLCGLNLKPKESNRHDPNLHFEYLLSGLNYNMKIPYAEFEFFKTDEYDVYIEDVRSDMKHLGFEESIDYACYAPKSEYYECSQIHTLYINNMDAALKLISSSYSDSKARNIEPDRQKVIAFFNTFEQSAFQ